MTRRQRRLLKKQAQASERGKQAKKSSAGKYAGFLALAVIVVGAIYGFGRLAKTTPDTTYTDRPVHWHAAIELEVCGEKRDLPGPKDGRMVGDPIYHHHGDNTWHIEGRIIAKEDIALGRFFDKHELPFDRDRLFDKKNGDECAPGKPGTVKMFVNGEPNGEFRDFIPQAIENAQEQIIKIIFE